MVCVVVVVVAVVGVVVVGGGVGGGGGGVDGCGVVVDGIVICFKFLVIQGTNFATFV